MFGSAAFGVAPCATTCKDPRWRAERHRRRRYNKTVADVSPLPNPFSVGLRVSEMRYWSILLQENQMALPSGGGYLKNARQARSAASTDFRFTETICTMALPAFSDMSLSFMRNMSRPSESAMTGLPM